MYAPLDPYMETDMADDCMLMLRRRQQQQAARFSDTRDEQLGIEAPHNDHNTSGRL